MYALDYYGLPRLHADFVGDIAASAGDEVNLAISYRAAGFEKNEFMMINGTDQSFYWPYAGTSQQDTDYVIITMVN